MTPTANFFIYLAINDLFFSAYPFLTTLFVPRGTSIWFHSSIVCEKHAVCSRSLCPRARSAENRSNLATLGGSTRSDHGPRGGFLTSLNVCLRQLTGQNVMTMATRPTARGAGDRGPRPAVRFEGNRGRGPRPTCYGLRRTLKVNSRGRFSALSREPLGKPRKHWGAYATPGQTRSGNAPHAKNQKLSAAE